MLDHSRQLGAGVNLGYTVAGILAVSVAVLSASQTPLTSLSLALPQPGLTATALDALVSHPSQEAAAIASAFERLRF